MCLSMCVSMCLSVSMVLWGTVSGDVERVVGKFPVEMSRNARQGTQDMFDKVLEPKLNPKP